MTRRTLRGCMRSAASGSDSASSRYRVSPPSDAARASSSALSAGDGGASGICQPSSSPQTYCPDPPATMGSLPRSSMSPMAPLSLSEIERDAVGLVRLHDVDHMVSDGCQVLPRRLGRADVHAPVDVAAVRARRPHRRAGGRSERPRPTCPSPLGRRRLRQCHCGPFRRERRRRYVPA